jgi:hypothetical protein
MATSSKTLVPSINYDVPTQSHKSSEVRLSASYSRFPWCLAWLGDLSQTSVCLSISAILTFLEGPVAHACNPSPRAEAEAGGRRVQGQPELVYGTKSHLNDIAVGVTLSRVVVCFVSHCTSLEINPTIFRTCRSQGADEKKKKKPKVKGNENFASPGSGKRIQAENGGWPTWTV